MSWLLKARLPVVKCIATIQHELGLKYHCLEIGWEMAPIFRGKEHMIIIILIYAHTKYQGQCSQKCRDKHSYCSQSHYREVPRWVIFMEQELRLGLDLSRLAVLKKKGLG